MYTSCNNCNAGQGTGHSTRRKSIAAVLPLGKNRRRRQPGGSVSPLHQQPPPTHPQTQEQEPPQQYHPQKSSTTATTTTTTTTTTLPTTTTSSDRFHRLASDRTEADTPCILTIDGRRYNVTAWAKAHPGGSSILQKYHQRDASKAFAAVHHSVHAYQMLPRFLLPQKEPAADDGLESDTTTLNDLLPSMVVHQLEQKTTRLQKIRRKLFTKEDPVGVHKYLGIFCLLNFIRMYYQMYFGDPAAGLATRGGHNNPWFSFLCLIPHGLLSLSSLIFETVPQERVVGKPTIWQEFRAHNIIFGLRSVLTAAAATLASTTTIRPVHTMNPTNVGVQLLVIRRRRRQLAVVFSSACVLAAMVAADRATSRLRIAGTMESTTATMPYWEGCSMATQKRFKRFYAYCQFMATLACLAVSNPAWPFAVLLAIQLASFLMTLVRKGLLSARGYHYWYTASLVAPWFVGLRDMAIMGSYRFPAMVILGYGLFTLRRCGVDKYHIWIPLVILRILFGDDCLIYHY